MDFMDFDSTCRPVDLSTCRPVNLSTSQPVDLSTCRPVNMSTCRPVNLSTCQPVDQSTCRPVNLSTCRPVDLSTCRPVNLVDLSTCHSQKRFSLPIGFDVPKHPVFYLFCIVYLLMSFFLIFFPHNNCIVLSFQTCLTSFIFLFIYLFR